MRTRFIPLAAALAVVVGADAGAQQAQLSAASTNHAIDRANLDTTCAACTDFYTFANGGWLKRNTIPPAYGEWGSFEELQDKNEAVVRSIDESAAADVRSGKAKPGTNRFKIGAFYGACLDTVAIEALGTKPIQASMARITAIASPAQLPAALSALEKSDGLAPSAWAPRRT